MMHVACFTVGLLPCGVRSSFKQYWEQLIRVEGFLKTPGRLLEVVCSGKATEDKSSLRC